MTSRKEKILEVALELFAKDGYNATSTNKIAKKADVSEGLIFRHYNNKEGLLDAIMRQAKERLAYFYGPILGYSDPKEVIRYFINFPYTVDQSEYNFWRLQFKLKWEEKYYDPQMVKPILDKLTWAFAELNYKEPEIEAQLLQHTIESIAIAMIRDGRETQVPMKTVLFEKYKL